MPGFCRGAGRIFLEEIRVMALASRGAMRDLSRYGKATTWDERNCGE
jgi:hypothetical protein